MLAGRHVNYQGSHSKGDIVASNVDLCRHFPNKFQEIVDTGEKDRKENSRSPLDKAGAIGASPQPAIPKAKSPKDKEETIAEAAGTDITIEYPKAQTAGLRVIRKGAWVHVYDENGVKLNKNAMRMSNLEDELDSFIQ